MNKFFDYIINKNPLLGLGLGLCPALAVTATLKSSLAMGLATLFVIVCTAIVTSLLKKCISDSTRIITIIMIIAAFSGVAEMVLKAYFYDTATNLSIYVSLIIVNFVVYNFAEKVALNESFGASILGSLGTGLGYLIILVLTGIIREACGNGTIWGAALPWLSDHHVSLISQAPGGFMILAFVLALFANFKKEDTAND